MNVQNLGERIEDLRTAVEKKRRNAALNIGGCVVELSGVALALYENSPLYAAVLGSTAGATALSGVYLTIGAIREGQVLASLEAVKVQHELLSAQTQSVA